MSPIRPIWRFSGGSVVPISTVSNATAVIFDGVDEYGQAPDNAALDFTAMTALVWVKGDAATIEDFLNKRERTGGVNEWSFTLRKDETNGTRLECVAIGAQDLSIIRLVRCVSFPNVFGPATGYVFCGMRWDPTLALADRLAGFVNGAIETDAGRFTISDNMTSLYQSASPLTIGSSWRDGAVFRPAAATIDEPMIWNVPLSDTQISDIFDIYASGIAFDPRVNGGSYDQAANLISFHRMGDDGADTNTLINDVHSIHNFVLVNMEAGDLVADTPP